MLRNRSNSGRALRYRCSTREMLAPVRKGTVHIVEYLSDIAHHGVEGFARGRITEEADGVISFLRITGHRNQGVFRQDTAESNRVVVQVTAAQGMQHIQHSNFIQAHSRFGVDIFPLPANTCSSSCSQVERGREDGWHGTNNSISTCWYKLVSASQPVFSLLSMISDARQETNQGLGVFSQRTAPAFGF
jgi:hypothetical protein